MIAKSLCFAAILAIVFAVSSGLDGQNELGRFGTKENLSHHLIVGSHVNGEHRVLSKYIYKPSKWLQIVTHEEVFQVYDSYDRITLVQALDQKTNGNGANATLLEGGPGMSYVRLRFKSKRGHSIKFVVELYAKRY